MPKTGTAQVLVAARESLTPALDFHDFLAKLVPKDKVNAERRVTLLEEAAPDHPHPARVWQRLACTMMNFAPSAKFVGRQTVQFYVPDGKYRMQVFALEDLQDGKMTVYCPNVLEEAMKGGLLAPSPNSEADVFVIAGCGEPLQIEPLDGSSPNPGAHFKDLLGWNRKALRITLPPSPSLAQIEAAELLCAVAAQHFARPAPAAPARALQH